MLLRAKLSSVQKVQKRLVENVTLLWALCEVPDLPKENKLNGSDDRRRRLSLHRERQLVDSFAFLSAATDNMYRVMAVCIEEDPGGDGMTIRLASNTGDLAFVTQGFNDIARTLEHASLRSTSLLFSTFKYMLKVGCSKVQDRYPPRLIPSGRYTG